MNLISSGTTAAARYTELESSRSPFLERARECAKYTLPMLYPPDGNSGSNNYETPFQSLGAYGVKNLSSKLLLILIPQASSFFRLKVNKFKTQKKAPSEEFMKQLEEALAMVEEAVMDEIEMKGDRSPTSEALKQLIIGGNTLLFRDPTEGMRVFNLAHYVVLRDPAGHPLEIVVHEKVAPAALPVDIQAHVMAQTKDSPDAHKSIDLYTHILRKATEWEICQECSGVKIPKTKGTYPLDGCPWIPLRLNRIDGEDYGRSYVEEYLGDLISLDGLMQAIIEGSAAAARMLVFVKPGGSTDAKAVSEAPNGAVVEGNAADVTVFQLQKYGDFRVAKETAAELVDRLSRAFLLNSSIQRSGERVTAEEIRYMASELEDALGGVYTILSQEFQIPYVKVTMLQMEKAGLLPTLPKGIINPTIITGLDALSRSHEGNKLMQYLATAGKLFGPQAVQGLINPLEALRRLALTEGIDTGGLIKTEEELAAEAQKNQMAALIEQLGPEAMKMFGNMGAAQGGVPNGQEEG